MKKYVKVNRNTKRNFLRSRERTLVSGRTYHVGKNAAKRARRGLS